MKTLVDILEELKAYDSEREWFEFKENWFKADELGEYISAISNSAAIQGKKAGYFVWGINDQSHGIVGTLFDYNQDINHEPLQHYLARQITPDINFHFEELFLEGKRVIMLVIPAAKLVPTAFGKERYIRIGSNKENLRKFPKKEAYLFEVLRNNTPTLENTPAFDDYLTFDELQLYYQKQGLMLIAPYFERSLGFYYEGEEYNMLAQLLSDNSKMSIRVVEFKGNNRSDDIISIHEYGNKCLLTTLFELLSYGKALNNQYDFEFDAYHEAIINAIEHNDWISGNSIMVSKFNDYLEILSYGGLPESLSVDGFWKGESIPVNKKLADILMQLSISFKIGRGIATIIKYYGKQAIEIRDKSIVVRIRIKRKQ